MKWTTGRLKDKESIEYFIPSILEKSVISEEDWNNFFLFSEQGKKPEQKTNGYNAIIEGKKWRGIHMQMYEDGVLDGSVPYIVLLEDMPKYVFEFVKKELFRGKDQKIMEDLWKKQKKLN